MAPYVYQPLKGTRNIRILRLSRGSDRTSPTGGIIATLEHIDLQSSTRPSYEPMSYVWAGPDSVPSWLSGSPGDDGAALRTIPLPTSCGRHLIISPSLCEILAHLVALSMNGAFWIDQVCINQEDLAERSKQVEIMHLVYAGGRKTLIWLYGDHDDFAFLRRAVDALKQCKRYSHSSEGKDVSDSWATLLSTGEAQVEERVMRVFDCLCSSSWFTRTWIVQEVINSAGFTMLCGRATFTPDDFWLLFDWSDFRSPARATIRARGFFRRNIGMKISQAYRRHPTLDRYLEGRVSGDIDLASLATDPRDLVYAMLNVVKPSASITPDYAVSVAEVFARTMRYLFNVQNDLRFLEVADGNSTLEDKVIIKGNVHLANHTGLRFADPALCGTLPSWVVDFSRTSKVRPLYVGSPQGGLSPFQAGLRYQHVPSTELHWSKLRLKGRTVDHVAYVATEHDFNALLNRREVLENPKSLKPDFLHLTELASLLNACDVLPQFKDWSHFPARRLAAVLYYGHALMAFANVRSNPETTFKSSLEATVDSYLEGESSNTYGHRMRGLAINRRFFISSRGRVGVGPISLQLGDAVTIPHGSTLPLILRPTGNGEYRFIGACNLEDCMMGEAVTWKEDEADDIVLV